LVYHMISTLQVDNYSFHTQSD